MKDASEALATGQVTHLSLDHDLGDDSRGTGYTVVVWTEQAAYFDNFSPPIITIHSDNGVGIANMRAGLKSIERIVASRSSNS